MKNEGPYILDWIAYHKMIGVTDFLIYANDCDDKTFEILLELNRMEVIEFRFNHILRRGVQKSALKWASFEPVVQNADWLMMLDVDEYINIHIGKRMLSDLINKHKGADAISIVWRRFGHAGVIDLSETPVPLEFDRAETDEITAHRFVKTIFRNTEKFERMGIHRPYLDAPEEDIDWVLPNGFKVPNDEKQGLLHVRKNYSYDVAQINHYALRSMEAFLIKKVRGRPNHMSHKTGPDYWEKFDHNEAEDMTICPLFEKALDIKSVYFRESPLLEELHFKSHEVHRKKVDAILSKPWAKPFVDEIIQLVNNTPQQETTKRA